MYLLTDKETNKIIETLTTAEIVDNKWVKSNKGSLIQLDMINLVEVAEVPATAKYYKENRFYDAEPVDVIIDQEARIKALEDTVLQLLGV